MQSAVTIGYGMTKDTRKVNKIHKWKWGQDPNDPDTGKDSPYIYTQPSKLLPVLPPDPVEPKWSGPDSGLRCFECKQDNYRIVDSKKIDIVTGYSIGREEFHDTKLLLVCPRCNRKVQMYKSVLDRLQYQLENKDES